MKDSIQKNKTHLTLTVQSLQAGQVLKLFISATSGSRFNLKEPESQQTHIFPAQIGHSLISTVLLKERCLKQLSCF